jgi:hypothetical protein
MTMIPKQRARVGQTFFFMKFCRSTTNPVLSLLRLYVAASETELMQHSHRNSFHQFDWLDFVDLLKPDDLHIMRGKNVPLPALISSYCAPIERATPHKLTGAGFPLARPTGTA